MIEPITDDDSDADLVTDYLDASTLLNSKTSSTATTNTDKFNTTPSSTTPNIKNYFVSTVDIKERNLMSGGNENGTPSSGSASNGHFHTTNNNNNSINNTITITTPSGHTNNNILINNHHINNINCNMVPIISVTPHSPGAKYNSILEDSLSHLQSIRETVQQMKNSSGQNATFANMGIMNSQLAASKVFHSCPSLPNLSVSNAIWLAAQNAMTYTLNDNRRKSWTAIEDLTDCTKNSHKR
jgi:A-kinase anchor protein 18